MNAPATISYTEHVSLRVKDIHWYLHFLSDVLDQALHEIHGTLRELRQCWTLCGLQFMTSAEFTASPSHDAGRFAHLGLVLDDLNAAFIAVHAWGEKALPRGRNWLQLPDGLALELMQAVSGSVALALAVKPRADDV
jgi:hypothetical protein